MKEVERRALDQGIKVEVSEGLRDPGRQAELVEQGKSQTLNSKHLKGNALDIHVRNPDGSANWDFDAYRPVAEIAKQVAAEKGVPNLVWGGDWKSLRDGVHFELAGSNYAAPQGTRKSNMMRGGAGQTSLLGQSGGDTLEPERPRGLLGGFFGPEGRDARSRLAIALEGMTLNPNTALIGSLQEGIKGRRDDKRTNATVQWLRSRGRDDLAAAIDGGLPAADALRIAMQPAGAVEGVSVGGNLVNPITGEIIYQGAQEQEQGEVRQIGDRIVRVNPDGTVAELYAAPQATVTQATGLELGLTGEDAGKIFNVDPSGKITAIGGGGVNVNLPGQPTIGTIPPGYQAIQNPDGTYRYEAIPGGPVATEAAAVEGQKSAFAATAEDSMRLIDSIINDPALPSITGMLQGRIPPLTQAGTNLLAKVEQVQGQAFLQAFDSLKGGGAITEREGFAAQNAIARLQRTQDNVAFAAALKELNALLDRGRRRALAGVQAREGDEYSGGRVINGVTVGEPIE
jgi:hypothetical protein